jgi:hypothetical protein
MCQRGGYSPPRIRSPSNDQMRPMVCYQVSTEQTGPDRVMSLLEKNALAYSMSLGRVACSYPHPYVAYPHVYPSPFLLTPNYSTYPSGN